MEEARAVATVTATLAFVSLAACGAGAQGQAMTHEPTPSSVGSKAPGSTSTTISTGLGADPPVSSASPEGPIPPRAITRPDPVPPAPLPSSVDHTCVAPGGSQGLTVRTRPRRDVLFDTEYSDKSSRAVRSSYTEGFGRGTADASGVFRAAWHVPATAPAGRATVHYAHDGGISEVHFSVADAGGVCS